MIVDVPGKFASTVTAPALEFLLLDDMADLFETTSTNGGRKIV